MPGALVSTHKLRGAGSEAVLGTASWPWKAWGRRQAATEPKPSSGAACTVGAALRRLLGHRGVGRGATFVGGKYKVRGLSEERPSV